MLGVSFGRGYPLPNSFQHLGNALPGFCTDQKSIGGIEADRAFNHFFGARNIGALQVNLVNDGNNFQSVVDRHISVGKRLSFHALRCVHHQQCAFARGQRARNLVGKIHVPRGIDQVELVSLSVLGLVHHADGVGFDGDAALALQIHGIQHLGLHLARRQRPGQLQQAVGQRGFPMVDVRDDREITNASAVHSSISDSNSRPQWRA